MNLSQYLTEEFLMKFLKFGVVGFSGVFVDFGFTAIAKEVFKIQKYVSNGIGFTIAATTNYLLNRWWTFQSHNPEVAVEYLKFIGISLIGLGINTAILWALVSKFKLNFYISKLGAIAVVTIWNFGMNYLFTF
ncbi:MAG: glycosyl transferase family 2 [Marinilabiliales bacterium]|nr:MAG: glycosyl transferase family 2 [Marinilabiliales bacterium]